MAGMNRAELNPYLGWGLLSVLVALLVCGLSSNASAQCVPRDIGHGGVVVEDCTGQPIPHVRVRASLDVPEVGVLVSAPGSRGDSVEQFRARTPRATVLIPAGPFQLAPAGAESRYVPEGFTVGGASGADWSVPDSPDHAVLLFDDKGAPLFVDRSLQVRYQPWIRAGLSGVEILHEGSVRTGCFDRGCEPRPRTGVGIDDAQRTLLVVSVGPGGATDAELAQLLADQGAHSALRVASGAVSRLSGPTGDLLASSEANARAPAAWLALTQGSVGPVGEIAARIQLSDGRNVAPGTPVQIRTAAGTVAQEVLIARDDGIFMTTLPQREYVLFVASEGEQGCRSCTPNVGSPEWCSFGLVAGVADCPESVFSIDRGDAEPFAEAPLRPDGEVPADAGVVPPLSSGLDSGCRASGGEGPGLGDLFGLAVILCVIRRRRRL